MALIAPDGEILDANASFHTLFGYETGELNGRSIDQLTSTEPDSPDGRRWRERCLRECADGLKGTLHSIIGVTKQGTTVPMEATLTQEVRDGETVTVAWVLDQTERSESDERFRQAIEGAPSGIVFVNEEGVIVQCNRQACRDFGYTTAELLGRPVEILTPASAAASHSQHRRNFFASPEQRPMGHGRDLFGRRKDGSEFPVEIGLTPIRSREGMWTMAGIVDISLRKQTETDLQMRSDDLLDFVYSASHDLKAPLATIRGLVAIAQDDLEEASYASVAEILKQVEQRAQRLSDLVDGSLALASADRTEQVKEMLSPAEVATSVVEEVSAEAALRQIEIEVSVPPELRIRTSQRQLSLILENLLRNAIKYHDPDKQNRFAAIRIEQRGSRLAIEVHDNGLGIPGDSQERVFEMFQRFHTHRAEGNGLGLAMVKKQVLKLGGEITFQSSPEGTTFQVELPVEEEL